MKKIIFILIFILLCSFTYSITDKNTKDFNPEFKKGIDITIDEEINIQLKTKDFNKQLIEPEIDKDNSNKKTYKNILKNTDIEYIKSYKQLKERIIIKSIPDYDTINFTIDIGKYSYAMSNDNNIYIKDGDMAFSSISKPFIEENGEVLPYTFDGLNYIIDLSKIDWSKFKFPVIIDPSYDVWDSSINTSKWDRVNTGVGSIIGWSETNDYLEGAISYTGSSTEGYIYSVKDWGDAPYILDFQILFNDNLVGDAQTTYNIRLGETPIWTDSGASGDNEADLYGTINLYDKKATKVNFSRCVLSTCNNITFDSSGQNNFSFIFGGEIASDGDSLDGWIRLYNFNYDAVYTIMQEASLESSDDLYPIVSTSNISAYCNATNWLNDDVNYNWELYKNSVLFSSGNSGNVTMGEKTNVYNISYLNTTNGDIFYLRCKATSNDTSTNTSWLESSLYSIGDNYIYDCTSEGYTNNSLAFNLTVKDEITNSNLYTNTTYQINYNGNILVNSTNSTTYSFCKFPYWQDFYGDLTFYFTKAGYNYVNFKRYNQLFNGSTYLAYMLSETSNYALISYKILGVDSSPIEGATIKILRSIGGIPTLIYEEKTDISGVINLYQDTTYLYTYNIITDDYPEKTFTLQPSEQVAEPDYTIKLTPSNNSYFNNPYSGIRYRHEPQDIIFNNSNKWTNLSFILEGSNLAEVGINFTGHDYQCIPSSCSDVITNSNGGTVTVSIYMNQTGMLDGAYWFRYLNDDKKYYINDNKIKIVNVIDKFGKSLVELIGDLKSNTSPNVRTTLAAIISLVFIGLGASLGLYGALLILPAVLANIALSLPSIGLIHPLVGMIISIFGIGMYILFSMERGI